MFIFWLTSVQRSLIQLLIIILTIIVIINAHKQIKKWIALIKNLTNKINKLN